MQFPGWEDWGEPFFLRKKNPTTYTSGIMKRVRQGTYTNQRHGGAFNTVRWIEKGDFSSLRHSVISDIKPFQSMSRINKVFIPERLTNWALLFTQKGRCISTTSSHVNASSTPWNVRQSWLLSPWWGTHLHLGDSGGGRRGAGFSSCEITEFYTIYWKKML